MTNGKCWDDSHTEILRKYAGLCSDETIAKRTGHDVRTVQRRRHMLGLPAFNYKLARYGTYAELSAQALEASPAIEAVTELIADFLHEYRGSGELSAKGAERLASILLGLECINQAVQDFSAQIEKRA